MEFGTNKPIYLHIYDIVVERIILNTWGEGYRVPSVRELAVELQVNPNTVMRAYDALCQNNIITPSRGIGYFVAEGARERALTGSRREFIERDLMEVFRRMETLGFTPNELTELYTNYQKQERDENK